VESAREEQILQIKSLYRLPRTAVSVSPGLWPLFSLLLAQPHLRAGGAVLIDEHLACGS
jgi:hypothetical protein